MTQPDPRYAAWQGHRLADVPSAVLYAAHELAVEAAGSNDLPKELTKKISDAYVAVIAPWVEAWRTEPREYPEAPTHLVKPPADELTLDDVHPMLLILLREATSRDTEDPFYKGYATGLKVAAQVAGLSTITVLSTTNPAVFRPKPAQEPPPEG